MGSSKNLHPLLTHLQSLLLHRLQHYFKTAEDSEPAEPEWPPFPTLDEADPSPFAQFLRERQPTPEELLILLIALAPQVFPNFFDAALARFVPAGTELPEFGGVKGGNCKGLLPTGETALFILAGNDLGERLRLQHLLRYGDFFRQESILTLEPVKSGEPPMSGRLLLDPEFAEWVLMGRVSPPGLSMDFPAQRIETGLTWEDLVLHPLTLRQLEEIKVWCRSGQRLLHEWGMAGRLRPGYRALFHGPPGTGKTITAGLLGKATERPVFRIDLSMVVSKYIGETEKNLSRVFERAERRNWILFFDEADALFGKRTETRNAHDRYANQETAYLLQRIETFDGIAILASNMRQNLDEAFLRRFESVIYFPLPRPEERLQLWQRALPPLATLEPGLELADFAQRYELSGGAIVNAVRYAALHAIENGGVLKRVDLVEGVERELRKEGKSV